VPEPSQPPEVVFEQSGHCPICRKEVMFVAYNSWFRDYLACSGCGSVPRERALIAVLERLFPDWRDGAVHESSPSQRGASLLLKAEAASYVETQYDTRIQAGTVHPSLGYQSENLENQTFADETFDFVITQDVMEHVFHPDLALKEIHRTLKPDGAYVLTVPIVRKSLPSQRRASISPEGNIHHILPAEYHGNPIDDSGSLVTIDWGYDIGSYFQANNFGSATIVYIDDIEMGIRAEFIEVIVARKSVFPIL
jgi:SAM-dependent methyltransferase